LVPAQSDCRTGKAFSIAKFLKACQTRKNLFPDASPNIPSNEIEGQLAALFAAGYRAVKIHARLSGLSVRTALRADLAAAVADLAVFNFGYQFAAENSLHPVDPLPWLLEPVAGARTLRMVFLHGGTVEILRGELSRASERAARSFTHPATI
jgi:hypothetical protein